MQDPDSASQFEYYLTDNVLKQIILPLVCQTPCNSSLGYIEICLLAKLPEYCRLLFVLIQTAGKLLKAMALS